MESWSPAQLEDIEKEPSTGLVNKHPSYLGYNGGREDRPFVSPPIQTRLLLGLRGLPSRGIQLQQLPLGGDKTPTLLRPPGPILGDERPQQRLTICVSRGVPAGARLARGHSAVMAGNRSCEILQQVVSCHQEHRKTQQRHVEHLKPSHATRLIQKFGKRHGGLVAGWPTASTRAQENTAPTTEGLY